MNATNADRATTRRPVPELLAELADESRDADDVALRLIGMRCAERGRVDGLEYACPIKRYLERNGWERAIIGNGLVWVGGAPAGWQDLPAKIAEFIERFDAGAYPQLFSFENANRDRI